MPLLIDLFEQYAPKNQFDLGFYTLVTATIVSRFIYYLSRVFSPLIFRGYADFPAETKADWDSRTVSTINAIIVAYLAYYIIFFDPVSSRICYENPASFVSPLSLFTIMIVAGYLINDTWIVWTHRNAISSVWSTLIHHVIALGGALFVWGTGVSHYYPLTYVLSEASTPFVNVRWWLYTAKLKNTKRYIVAGIAMTILFFLIRILLVPYMVLHSYSRLTIEGIRALPTKDFIMTTFFPAVGNLLNFYWFIYIVRGLVRALQPNKNKPKEA